MFFLSTFCFAKLLLNNRVIDIFKNHLDKIIYIRFCDILMQDETPTIRCPICDSSDLKVTSMLYSVPFFNELAFFIMECPKCHFRHNDIFSAELRKPSRWTLVVDDPSKLYIQVIRSSSGTIRIPDFGIDIEPGPSAEGYISNVEGVLHRIKSVLKMATDFAESKEQKDHGLHLMDELNKAIEGTRTFTLIIEDPAGVSGIVPDDLSFVKYEELTPEEASRLKGAPFWIDLARDKVRKRKG